jgi:hypothetical protein
MEVRQWLLLIPLVASLGCQGCRNSVDYSQSLTPARRAAVEDSVRQFTVAVAHDVTQEGPVAWRKHFADTPAFFMAVNGKLVFPNSGSATEGIQSFAHTIRHIDLHWGDDVRIDPLTPDFAVVATPWVEVQIDLKGQQVTTGGFFTALAENRNGQWQFRNAHWSEPVPPPKVP